MKVRSENKKSVYALAVLGVVAVYMVYSQFFSGPSYKAVTPQTMRPAASSDAGGAETSSGTSSGPDVSQAKSRVKRGTASSSKNGEFHPALVPKKPEDRVDTATVDPTIRFDLLDRVMKVPAAGGDRDLFQILKSPPVKQSTLVADAEPKIKPYIPIGPRRPLPPTPTPPPQPPPPLQIPFKFYGTSAVHPDGKRTAYFIIPGSSPETDEIFMADEGDVIKKRFRIVQIGLDKVLVEDVTDKRRQPLNMEKEVTQ